MMNTAVFRRELLDRLRATRTIASILACAVMASVLVWLRWPTDSRLDVVSQASAQVFGPLTYALAVAIFLLVPAFPATALVGERRRGTLALLLNSPMSRAEIYFGKLASNFVLAAIIVSVSLPALAACYAMGGITLGRHVFPLLAVLLAMSLQFSALVYGSARARRQPMRVCAGATQPHWHWSCSRWPRRPLLATSPAWQAHWLAC